MSLSKDNDGNIYVAYVYEPTVSSYDKSGKLRWEVTRPWLSRKNDPVKAKIYGGMSLNPKASVYHLDVAFHKGLVWVSTDEQESALAIFDPEKGAFKGHVKLSYRARALASFEGVLYVLDATENRLYLYGGEQTLGSITKAPGYRVRHVISEGTQIAGNTETAESCCGSSCGCSGKDKDASAKKKACGGSCCGD